MYKFVLALLVSTLVVSAVALAQQSGKKQEQGSRMQEMMEEMMKGKKGDEGGMSGMMGMMGQMEKMMDQCSAMMESMHTGSGEAKEGQKR